MKNEKGVTLVALVTTIVLIIILASITTYTGIESYQSMRTQAFVSKMIALQEKVDVFCDKYTVTEINGLGVTYDTLSDTDAKAVLEAVIADGSASKLNSWFDVDNSTGNYRYFSIADIESKIGLANFDVAIWLNPLTRNVIAVEGIKVDGVTYYRQYDLTGGQTLKQPVKDTNNTLSDADYKLLTYDNKAIIKFSKQYSEISYTLEGGQTVTFSNTNEIELPYSGVYTITINGTNQSQKNTTVSATIVNKPMLVEGMVPIIPNGDNYTDIDVTNAEQYQNWYNYDSSLKQWANARLQDGSIYVWIPRFSYKMNGAKAEVKFLKEFSDITTEGKAIAADYKVAPAFKNGVSTAFANGEWDNEIAGFWVAKYEAINNSSIPKCVETSTTVWKVTPANAFVYCRNMETKTALFRKSGETTDAITTKVSGTLTDGIYQVDTNNIDTHLIKNSEWGAVAYLSYSDYGAQATNYQGGVYPGKDCGSNRERSTTGNIYGVYGMSGGNPEITASGLTITAYNSLDTSNKYATKYPSTNTNTTIFGDAVNNTEVSGFSVTKTLPTTSNPIFLRGGTTTSGNIFIYQNQAVATTNCFRPVIIVEY